MNLQSTTSQLVHLLGALPEDERIDAINEVRRAIHQVSPLKEHPVDFVEWVKCDSVLAQPLNPNDVAPPEFKLLTHSILSNGYTMPIVAHEEDVDGSTMRVTVDGFHRGKVGKYVPDVRESTRGRLPLTQIRAERADMPSRIAATIEHNRARGEHRVDQMSELVRQLHEAGWREDKIMEELGMTSDEVRRLKQITGLAAMFSAREFSEAWEPDE